LVDVRILGFGLGLRWISTSGWGGCWRCPEYALLSFGKEEPGPPGPGVPEREAHGYDWKFAFNIFKVFNNELLQGV
jgi:hypothetical protein